MRLRMDAATWLADRGFGKSTVNSGSQAPGIGDFTFIIGDNDAMGNPINDMHTYTIERDRPAAMDDLP